MSGALERTRALPGSQADNIQFDDSVFAFTAEVDGDDYVGETTAPWSGEDIEFSMDENDEVKGTLGGWLLGGSLTAPQVDEATRLHH